MMPPSALTAGASFRTGQSERHPDGARRLIERQQIYVREVKHISDSGVFKVVHGYSNKPARVSGCQVFPINLNSSSFDEPNRQAGRTEWSPQTEYPMTCELVIKMPFRSGVAGAYVRPLVAAIPAAAAVYVFSRSVAHAIWALFALEVLGVGAIFIGTSLFICLNSRERAEIRAKLTRRNRGALIREL